MDIYVKNAKWEYDYTVIKMKEKENINREIREIERIKELMIKTEYDFFSGAWW